MKTIGTLFVISGPSGSGKTTLAEKALSLKGLRSSLQKSISFTTRPRRPNEVEGKDYFFIAKDEFFALRRQKKILEWTRYLEYYYGTPRDPVETALASGTNLLLCLDVRGARALKKAYPRGSVTIFVKPPSLIALRERIEKRCALSPKEVAARLAQAKRELREAAKYEHCVVNDSLSRAVRELKNIIAGYIKTKR